jgi:ketosteroid isomerase-like protein/quercetin dioxygenase-like cupin family protein
MPHNLRRHSTRMLALLLTCAALSSARAQTDEQAIRTLDSLWVVAFGARDTVKLATFYTADALGLYSNMPIARGAPAIRRAYAEMSGLPGARMTATPMSIRISNDRNLATNTGVYHFTYNGPSGPVVDSGSYIEVLQKVNGQWKIVNEIVTSHAPMPTMAVYDTAGTMGMTGAAKVTWIPLEVKGFAPGAKMSVIHGDPSGSGDFTMRLWFPDGYKFPVHWHPKAEHSTVLSGTLLLGMGKQANASALNAYQPGDFLYLPAKTPHFGGAKGATVIQLHGMGPFAVYVGTP